MRTAIYVIEPTMITLCTQDMHDANVQLYRYQGRLPPRCAAGTYDLPIGIYLVPSVGAITATGPGVRTQVAIADKDPWPEPPAAIVALEPGADATSVKAFFQIAKAIGD